MYFVCVMQKEEDCFILMLDGDVDFEPEAVERLLHGMRHREVGIVCGRILPKGAGNAIYDPVLKN